MEINDTTPEQRRKIIHDYFYLSDIHKDPSMRLITSSNIQVLFTLYDKYLFNSSIIV